jgi:hypothetical protein
MSPIVTIARNTKRDQFKNRSFLRSGFSRFRGLRCYRNETIKIIPRLIEPSCLGARPELVKGQSSKPRGLQEREFFVGSLKLRAPRVENSAPSRLGSPSYEEAHSYTGLNAENIVLSTRKRRVSSDIAAKIDQPNFRELLSNDLTKAVKRATIDELGLSRTR